MKKTTLTEIGSLLNGDTKKTDKHYYGVIKAVNRNATTNKVESYDVSLGGDSDVVKCRKTTGAKLGDKVLVTLLSTGTGIVTNTIGGDTDATDALTKADEVATDLDTNYSTTEEVEEMIEEGGGGSYEMAQWAAGASDTDAPTTGWSDTMPELTASYPYLWQRIVTVTDGTETVTTQPQRASTLDGLYVFSNQARSGTATVIDGGSIKADTLLQIGKSSKNNVLVDDNGLDIRYGSTTLASFGSSDITLGGGKGQIITDNSNNGIQLYSHHNNYNTWDAYCGCWGSEVQMKSEYDVDTIDAYNSVLMNSSSSDTTFNLYSQFRDTRTGGAYTNGRILLSSSNDNVTTFQVEANEVIFPWSSGLVIEEYTSSNITKSSGATYSENISISKAKYYPIAIAGFYTSNGTSGSGYTNLCYTSAYLTNQATGSATLNIRLQAIGGSCSNAKAIVKVLWGRITA